MAIITDNVRNGAVDGMGRGLTGSETGIGGITIVSATPDEVLTGQTGSDVAWDANASELYMCEAQGGSEWVHLGSIA